MHQKINLISKRNKVERIINDDNTFISKIFNDANDLKREYEVLKLLKSKGAYVPDILETKENTLMLEDLGDLTLLSWYENIEKQDKHDYEKMILRLCCWLKNFYRITYSHFNRPYILFDVNFRNFIIKDTEIYGIDFEQSGFGNIEIDTGKLAAYALTYAPAMTEWKIKFRDKLIQILSEELLMDKNIVLNEELKELAAIKDRRMLK